MNFQHLRHFVAVAEERHFGLAAERLGMAQPPLSQSIQRLESSLGCHLFVRGRRPIEITPAGEALLRNAREILDLVEYARRSTIVASQTGFTCITIGFTPNALTETVPRAMRTIKELLPSVDIKLIEGSSDEQIKGLLSGDVDIAFIPEPSAEIRGLDVREIDRSIHVVAVPERSPLASKRDLTMRDLEGESLILAPERFRPDYRAALVQAFRNAHVPFRVVQEAVFDHTRLRMVAAGLGITFVSEAAAPRGYPGVAILRVRDLPDNVSMGQCMLWRTAVSPAARKIFEAACRSVDRRQQRSTAPSI